MPITRTITQGGFTFQGRRYWAPELDQHIGSTLEIKSLPDDKRLSVLVGGKQIELVALSNGEECPSCGQKDIEPTDNFCTWCAHDLRPHHIKRPCCGFSSMRFPHNYCPICGADTESITTVNP